MQKLLPFGSEVVDIFPCTGSVRDRVAVVTIPSFDEPLSNITLNVALCTPQGYPTKLCDLAIGELHLALISK